MTLRYLQPSLKSVALEKKNFEQNIKSCEPEWSSHEYSRSLGAAIQRAGKGVRHLFG